MIDTNIKERIKSLSPDYTEFVLSNFGRECAFVLGKEAGFDEEKIDIFENGIMLYLLLFLSFEGLVDFISNECTFDRGRSRLLAEAVVGTLPDWFSEQHQQTYDKIYGQERLSLGGEPIRSSSQEDILNRAPRTIAEDAQASRWGSAN